MKIRRTSAEIFVVLGCFLVVIFTVLQILTLTRDNVSLVKQRTWNLNAAKAPQKLSQSRDALAKKNRLASLQAKLKLRHKIRLEIMALEKAMSDIIKEKAITPVETSELIQNEVYARRVKNIIEKVNKDTMALTAKNLSTSRPEEPQAYGDTSGDAINGRDRFPDSGNMQMPYFRYGLPLTFESVFRARERPNLGVKSKITRLKHFQDLDASEENRFGNMVEEAQNFGEDNFSTTYEDNFQRVKKQFLEGTELYVDEDLLRKQNDSRYEVCPRIPETLVGNTTDILLNVTLDIQEVLANNTDVMMGGEWKPATCASRHRVAIIIPYRDRWNHLKVLLYYLIPTLKRQQVHFRIFVVEQYGNETFNKGRIMNAAFKEALKLFDFHCVTFHDVDLVPEDDRNMYTCTEQPKHMSNSIDKFKYILPYQGLVGGVLMFKREHFQLVNGYSNMYWGWGAEDDDMTTRILSHGLRIYRPPSNIARYKMVKHDGRKSSEVAVRMRLLRSAAKRSKIEGLNNVKYRLLQTHIQQLFTHFIVDIDGLGDLCNGECPYLCVPPSASAATARNKSTC